MKEAHDSKLSIHLASTKMYQDLKKTFWWTRMKSDVARFVSQCDVCRRMKAEHQRPAGLLRWTLSPGFQDLREATMQSSLSWITCPKSPTAQLK